MSELENFRRRYERHVGHVVAGEFKASLADMIPENLPAVFDGVDVPRGAVDGHRIVGVRADGDRMIGETVYVIEGREIGLRSIWQLRDGEWYAGALENFAPESVA
ncbi:hypothetical protein [Gordonia terrae]|uniref:hypothetical protein n=1 Tax=Gordonia terrae TaxID=2055 RepID=UPI003F6ABD03